MGYVLSQSSISIPASTMKNKVPHVHLAQFGRPLHHLPRQFISRPPHLTQPAQPPQFGNHLLIPKVAIMLEFRLPRECDPGRVYDNPCRHAKDPVVLDLSRFFLLGEGVDGGVLGLVAGAARLDGVVGAADKELVHYSIPGEWVSPLG